MEPQDYISRVVSLAHGVVLIVPDTEDLETVARKISSVIGDAAVHIKITGRYLRDGEAAELLEPLRRGSTALLSCAPGLENFGIELADQWERWAEAHEYTTLVVNRTLTFEPWPNIDNPGSITVIVHSNDLGRIDWARRAHLRDEHLEYLRSAQEHSPELELGAGGDRVSFRDLCLLHLQDPPGTAARDLRAIISLSEQATWTDVQLILRNGLGYRWVLQQMVSLGLIDDTKWAYAMTAFDFIAQAKSGMGSGMTRHVYESIWEAVWLNDFLYESTEHIFRGQVNADWPQTPTLLRPPITVNNLMARARSTQAFTSELTHDSTGADLSPDEKLAIAQHYGFPTGLLDYSKSFAVAAFFATKRLSSTDQSELGIIYYMENTQSERSKGVEWKARLTLADFSLLDAVGLRTGEITVLEPRLGYADNRILRQQAVFVKDFDVFDLQDMVIDKVYFKQQPGEVYRDPANGITEEDLLPAEAPLEHLAASRRSLFTANSTVEDMTYFGVHLDHVRLIGTAGWQSFAQIRACGEYFDRLREYASPSLQGKIAEIFAKYFASARLEAALSEYLSSSSEESPTRPITAAADALADLASINRNKFWREARYLLFPGPEEEYPRCDEVDQESRVDSVVGDAAVAASAMIFLVGWEQLRYVRGEAARNLFTEAANIATGGSLYDSVNFIRLEFV